MTAGMKKRHANKTYHLGSKGVSPYYIVSPCHKICDGLSPIVWMRKLKSPRKMEELEFEPSSTLMESLNHFFPQYHFCVNTT